MYIPDWGFVKALKRIDPKLDVRWAPKRCRWVVTRTVFQPGMCNPVPVDVLVVEDHLQRFMSLDNRTLQVLRRCDTHSRGWRTIMREALDQQTRHEELEEKHIADDLEDLARYEVADHVARDLDDLDIGAANVPKEDLRLPEVEA